MSSESAISVRGISKKYTVYANPKDRLKQAVATRLSSLFKIQSKKYHTEFNALKSISLEVKKGERLGIIGRNGSGKSTLLQIVCGTLTPSTGEVEINGKVAALLELGSGFNPEFSGRENILINATVLGLSKKQIDERIESIIDFSGIEEFIDQPVKTYSSGMFVRLAFSVIAHVDADILVIDEALAVGDAIFNQKCMRFMDEFSKRGTIILVTHDTSAVTGFCTRAVWIEKGTVVEDGDTKSVCEAYLAAIYGETQHMDDSVTPTIESFKDSDFQDFRQTLINHSTIRNDIEVFKFNADSDKFGTKHAAIINVRLFSKMGTPLSWTLGGEIVELRIKAQAIKEIANPIIGFIVKDKYGRNLFGDNTYITHAERKNSVPKGKKFSGLFEFRMPILPAGEYVISAAVADGTQESHEMCEWIHDALVFKSHANSIANGLIGIPMKNIEIKIEI